LESRAGELSPNIEMLGTGTILSQSRESLFLKMIPSRSPFLLKLNDDAKIVSAYLLNGPELFPKGIDLIYEHDGYEISVRTLKTTSDFRKNNKDHKNDCVISHELTLRNVRNQTISAEKALSELSVFRNFLTFVRGGYCGIGHIQGRTDDNQICYSYLGFNKSDPFKLTTGWFDFGISSNLPTLYSAYRRAVDNSPDTFAILRSIEFYRASNTISESTKEVALVSSFAALETLVPHVLLTRAGWSKDLMKSKSKFVDQLRAASAFIRLSSEPFENSPELKKKLRGMSGHDEFDLLGVFRNRIVHQSKKFDYSGIELHEMWCFSQWLVEIYIFYMIGYSEKMNDRRKYSGWRGAEVNVPIGL